MGPGLHSEDHLPLAVDQVQDGVFTTAQPPPRTTYTGTWWSLSDNSWLTVGLRWGLSPSTVLQLSYTSVVQDLAVPGAVGPGLHSEDHLPLAVDQVQDGVLLSHHHAQLTQETFLQFWNKTVLSN